MGIRVLKFGGTSVDTAEHRDVAARHATLAPEPRELNLMMACGVTIPTVVMAQTLNAPGYPATALTGGQAGIITDELFGDARIRAINPHFVISALAQGRIPVVAGFQGVTDAGTGRHG